MEYHKIANLLGSNISDKVTKFITKKWVELPDLSVNADDRYKPSKLIRFKTQKHQCYNQIYVIKVMHVLLLKELLVLQIQIMMHVKRN